MSKGMKLAGYVCFLCILVIAFILVSYLLFIHQSTYIVTMTACSVFGAITYCALKKVSGIEPKVSWLESILQLLNHKVKSTNSPGEDPANKKET